MRKTIIVYQTPVGNFDKAKDENNNRISEGHLLSIMGLYRFDMTIEGHAIEFNKNQYTYFIDVYTR